MSAAQAWATRIQQAANASETFAAAARWLDTKIAWRFGTASYWFKLYRGRIIDAAPYNPITNMLGYDVLVLSTPEAWHRVLAGTTTYGRESSTGGIMADGNRIECERAIKALYVLGSEVIAAAGLPPELEA